jgi:hypothetical protein
MYSLRFSLDVLKRRTYDLKLVYNLFGFQCITGASATIGFFFHNTFFYEVLYIAQSNNLRIFCGD